MKFSEVITRVDSDVHAKGQGQGSKVKVTAVKSNFGQILPFPDDNSNTDSDMAPKLYRKLLEVVERIPIVFQGHPSNFKVTARKRNDGLAPICSNLTVSGS